MSEKTAEEWRVYWYEDVCERALPIDAVVSLDNIIDQAMAQARAEAIAWVTDLCSKHPHATAGTIADELRKGPPEFPRRIHLDEEQNAPQAIARPGHCNDDNCPDCYNRAGQMHDLMDLIWRARDAGLLRGEWRHEASELLGQFNPGRKNATRAYCPEDGE